MNCLTWFRVHFTKFFRALWVMFVFHSNKVMYSWKIRLDRINCFNYVCGLTDLIISALVIFGKSLSGFLSSFLIIQHVSVFAVYSYMWKHNEHVRKSKICIALTGDIKLITCSCSWVLWIMLERNWSFWGNSAFWGWILFYGNWYWETRLLWRGVAYCFFNGRFLKSYFTKKWKYRHHLHWILFMNAYHSFLSSAFNLIIFKWPIPLNHWCSSLEKYR